ncbi:MAG: hemerythrin domain-containing protein [Bryobacteraceae bacterium]
MTTTTHPVDVLMAEHRVIEGVLRALEQRMAELDQPPFPYDFLTQALDFFRNFADGCHHAKEEELLFPRLEQRGIPREYGPIGCMLKEHVQGRECVARMSANLDAARDGAGDAREAVRAAAREYITLLRQHIYKEDNILFQMAIRALDSDDAAELLARFAEPSNPRLSAEVRRRYEALAERLCGDAAVAR